MLALKIDPATGMLLFPELDAALAPRSAWSSAPERLKAAIVKEKDIRNGWIWRSIAEADLEGRPVDVALGYCQERLEMVSMSLAGVKDGDWPSYEECMEEVFVVTTALQAQLGVSLGTGGSADFPWGSAYSRYDPKGGLASSGLTYTVPASSKPAPAVGFDHEGSTPKGKHAPRGRRSFSWRFIADLFGSARKAKRGK